MGWYLWILLGVLLGSGVTGLAFWIIFRPAKTAGPLPELDRRIEDLVLEAETLEAGGEFKRHTVLARLIKEFPSEKVRDLALAIEFAVRRVL
jgi:hypothetical protein